MLFVCTVVSLLTFFSQRKTRIFVYSLDANVRDNKFDRRTGFTGESMAKLLAHHSASPVSTHEKGEPLYFLPVRLDNGCVDAISILRERSQTAPKLNLAGVRPQGRVEDGLELVLANTDEVNLLRMRIQYRLCFELNYDGAARCRVQRRHQMEGFGRDNSLWKDVRAHRR